MLDPGDGAGVAGEAQEGFAFQRQHVLLGQGVGHVCLSAAQHLGEAGGHDLVIGRRHAEFAEAIDRQGQRRLAACARGAECGGLGGMVAVQQGQRAGFGVGKQAVAVHGDAVALAQHAHFTRLCARAGNLRGGHHFEHFGGCGHRAFGHTGGGLPAVQHLAAAAPAGDQTHAAFDQTDVGFGMRLNGIGVEADLAAPAQRHAKGRSDDGEGGVFQRLKGLLAARDQLVDFPPSGDVDREQG